MSTKKSDPTVKSPTMAATDPVPLSEADDYAGTREYVDMPDEDKPDPSTVAQYEVPPTEGTFAEPDSKKDA